MTQGYGSPQVHTVRKHYNFDDSDDGGRGERLVYDGHGGLTGSPFLPGWRTDWNEEWSCFEWTMESNPQVTVWERPQPIAPSIAVPSSILWVTGHWDASPFLLAVGHDSGLREPAGAHGEEALQLR